ncbi:MAG: NADH-quinone oxidoreductase subunit L [Candidatus Gastranaerophilaceae bacterium]|jgi:NAD(P)H-quinone oxidoreductase subunit 5
MFLDFFVNNIWIVPLLPLWAFLIVIFGINLNVYESKKITATITCLSTFAGFVFSIFALVKCLNTANFNYEYNQFWSIAENIKLSVGYLLDNLSIMMLVLVTSVSLLIQIYSHEYMNKDEGYHRFFAYLNFFNFSMLGLVLSSNLFQMYIFWELVGVSSYLLIGFWFRKPSAAKAASKAFIMNRIGDFGLLAGTAAFFAYSLLFWQINNQTYLSFSAMPTAAVFALRNSGPVIYSFICFGIFLGAVAKSAQIPLHTWLPDAMEGPTPISALIHAATMVAAGVFLIARCYPIFELSPFIMNLIAATGAVTAIVAATIAVVQFDIKKALAYSTCSQLGYMVMAMGAGAYSAGLFHLFTHAYFKAMLFLCSGAVIHSIANQQDMRFMGGLRKHMPVVSYTYLIGVLAISGILFSGFWSKEEIFTHLEENKQYLLLIVGLITAFLTSFYMFRTYFMTFEGEYRGHADIHKPNAVLTVPLVILAIPSAIIGILLSGKFFNIQSFDNFITNAHSATINATIIIPVISIILALAGALFAFIFYGRTTSHPELATSSLAKQVQNDGSKCSCCITDLCRNKWYFDDVYEFFIDKVFLNIAKLADVFDKYIIDGFINLIAFCTILKSKILRFIQNGSVQTYTTISLGGFSVLIFLIMSIWFYFNYGAIQ